MEEFLSSMNGADSVNSKTENLLSKQEYTPESLRSLERGNRLPATDSTGNEITFKSFASRDLRNDSVDK